jgi:NAD-dependent deacetylase
MVDREIVDRIATQLGQARQVLVLTGAGISVASGIKTYRGPAGMWNDAQLLAAHHADALPGSLPIIWATKGPVRAQALAALPNPAHLALAQLEQQLATRDGQLTIATQNIDGLHQKAGSKNVLELHGSVLRSRCSDPGCVLPPFPDQTIPPANGPLPTCPRCNQPLRPDIVLFGERLPAPAIDLAKHLSHQADILLVVGTSGVVHPAAGLIEKAATWGAQCYLINKDPWENPHPGITQTLLGPAEQILPQLI